MADTLSASKIDRAEVCPASFALPAVFGPSNAEATAGTEFHDDMRDIARAGAAGQAVAAPTWRLALFDELSDGADRIFAERCFAFDPVTGRGRDMGTHDRDYSGLRPGEIGGTIDHLAIRGRKGTVTDYKTGYLGADIDTAQLAHNAVAVADAFDLDEVEVCLAIVDLDDESYFVKRKLLDSFALAGQADRIVLADARVKAARAKAAQGLLLDVTETPDGCRYCPAKQSCPAKTQAISLVLRTEHVALPTAEELLAGASPEAVARAWLLSKALEDLAGNVRRLAVERARFSRLPLSDGSYLEAVAVEKESIGDIDKAIAALSPMLGDAVAGLVETKRTLAKGAIETLAGSTAARGGKDKAKRAAVEVLRSAGALKTSVHYEIKRKAGLSMAIQDGVYDCKATGKVEYGISSNGTDQIAVEIDILDGKLESLGRRTVYLSFSQAAAQYAIEKLRALGFSGTRLDDLVGLGTTTARCSGKTERDNDRDGNPRERQSWDVFGGSGKAFKTEMSDKDKARLADRFAAMLGGEAPPPRAARSPASGSNGTAGLEPPPGRFSDDFG